MLLEPGVVGFVLNGIAFGNKAMLCFRAAGCCVPCVPIFWNKGVTKEGNDDFSPLLCKPYHRNAFWHPLFFRQFF